MCSLTGLRRCYAFWRLCWALDAIWLGPRAPGLPAIRIEREPNN